MFICDIKIPLTPLIKTKQVLVEFRNPDRILKIQKHIIFPAVPIPSIAISSSYHQRINLIQKGFNLNAIRFLAETFQQFSKIFTIISISFSHKYNYWKIKKYVERNLWFCLFNCMNCAATGRWEHQSRSPLLLGVEGVIESRKTKLKFACLEGMIETL